jgi:heme-degrading monooxygenase HmoA
MLNRTKEFMFSAMLEVNPTAEQFDGYLGMAKMLRRELEAIHGSVDNTRYASLARQGWLPSLSSWRGEKSLIRWRVTTNHHKVQQAANDRVFADYRLRIGQTVADTRVPVAHLYRMGVRKVRSPRGASILCRGTAQSVRRS